MNFHRPFTAHDRQPMPRALAMLCLIAAMAITGSNVPLMKMLLVTFPPEILLTLRFALASAILFVIVRDEPGPRLATLDLRQWGAVAVLGIVGSVLFTLFAFEGVRRTSATSAGIILAALPAVVAVIGMALRERLRRGDMLMIALAVIGVAIIQTQASGASRGDGPSDPLVGNLLIGCAVLCEAAFVVVARKISAHLKPLRLALGVAVVSLLACLPVGLPALVRFDWAGVSTGAWLLFLWYAVNASILCTVLWYRGAAHVETWAAGLATAAVPVAALVFAVAALGEKIGAAQIAGAALVIAAIAAGTLSRR